MKLSNSLTSTKSSTCSPSSWTFTASPKPSRFRSLTIRAFWITVPVLQVERSAAWASRRTTPTTWASATRPRCLSSLGSQAMRVSCATGISTASLILIAHAPCLSVNSIRLSAAAGRFIPDWSPSSRCSNAPQMAASSLATPRTPCSNHVTTTKACRVRVCFWSA